MEVQSSSVNLKAILEAKIKVKQTKNFSSLYSSIIPIITYLHNKEKLFSIPLNLYIKLYRIDLTQWNDILDKISQSKYTIQIQVNVSPYVYLMSR